MKCADIQKEQVKLWRLKRFWVPLLAVLPIAGILIVATKPNLQFWSNSFGGQELDSTYRYKFQRPNPGKVTVDLEKEIAFYQERIRNDPNGGLNRAMLAQTYLRMARATGETSWYLLAEQTAQQSLAKLSFNNEPAVMVLAKVATAKHDFGEAIRLAKQVQGNEDTLATLVTANLATGNISAASQAANTLVAKSPSLGSLTLRALVNVALGKDAEAIADFQQALALEEPEETGSSVWTRTLLGRFYFKRGQLELASQVYQEALRVLPKYSPALLNLAELEIRRGNYQAADRLYSQFLFHIERSPNIYDHAVLRGMARVRELQGDSLAAKEWRNKAEARLREDMSSFGHRGELARLLLERGDSQDITEALSLMEAEVKIRRDAESLNIWAWALASAGRWQEAEKAMSEALRWGIRDPAMLYRAGTIAEKVGKEAEAIAFFKLAQQTDPNFDEKARQALGLGVGLLGLN